MVGLKKVVHGTIMKVKSNVLKTNGVGTIIQVLQVPWLQINGLIMTNTTSVMTVLGFLLQSKEKMAGFKRLMVHGTITKTEFQLVTSGQATTIYYRMVKWRQINGQITIVITLELMVLGYQIHLLKEIKKKFFQIQHVDISEQNNSIVVTIQW